MLESEYESFSTEELLELRKQYKDKAAEVSREWSKIRRTLLKRKVHLINTVNQLEQDRLDEVGELDSKHFCVH